MFGQAFVCAGMVRIQSKLDRPRKEFTAKCSEPQVVDSDVRNGGSGVNMMKVCPLVIGNTRKIAKTVLTLLDMRIMCCSL